MNDDDPAVGPLLRFDRGPCFLTRGWSSKPRRQPRPSLRHFFNSCNFYDLLLRPPVPLRIESTTDTYTVPTFRGCQRVRIMHASVCTTTEPSELVTGRQRVRIMRVGVRTLGEVGELFVVCAGALCEADRVPKMPNFARVRLALGVRS